MNMAAEGAVWVSILWHWASNVRLRILSKLKLSPVIVDVTGESGIWVSILWHWASDVRLWVLFNTSLNLGPIVMDVA